VVKPAWFDGTYHHDVVAKVVANRAMIQREQHVLERVCVLPHSGDVCASLVMPVTHTTNAQLQAAYSRVFASSDLTTCRKLATKMDAQLLMRDAGVGLLTILSRNRTLEPPAYTLRNAVSGMVPIARFLAALHDQRITHGDLKVENIMCDERDGMRLRLIDFGKASLPEDAPSRKPPEFTPAYYASQSKGNEGSDFNLPLIDFVLHRTLLLAPGLTALDMRTAHEESMKVHHIKVTSLMIALRSKIPALKSIKLDYLLHICRTRYSTAKWMPAVTPAEEEAKIIASVRYWTAIWARDFQQAKIESQTGGSAFAKSCDVYGFGALMLQLLVMCRPHTQELAVQVGALVAQTFVEGHSRLTMAEVARVLEKM
jgi:hypothetical protein